MDEEVSFRNKELSSRKHWFTKDNTSSILMECNGKQSTPSVLKHMDIRYFYVTDHMKNKDINIECCSTEDMVAVYFTSPLQGSLFVKLHN